MPSLLETVDVTFVVLGDCALAISPVCLSRIDVRSYPRRDTSCAFAGTELGARLTGFCFR